MTSLDFDKRYLLFCGCGNPYCPTIWYLNLQEAYSEAMNREEHTQKIFEIDLYTNECKFITEIEKPE